MPASIIAFIVFYCVALCCYFVTETGKKFIYRVINKCILALMFTIFAIVVFVSSPTRYPTTSFHVVLLVAIILAALGDVFLLFSFTGGLYFFLAGNIAFITYETCLLTNSGITISSFWWVYLVAAIILSALVFCALKFPNFFKIGDKKAPVFLYGAAIFTHGFTGLALAILLPQYYLLGVGSILFMLSDIVIVFNRFVCPDNKWVLRLNSCLYFIGLLCIVLSMAL